MRKTTLITLSLVILMGAVFAAIYFGPRFGKTAIVDELATKFIADVQFKDFRQAALYHHKLERDRVDIGRTIEKLFLMKPEMIDIQDYQVIKSGVDGNRARVHMRVKFQRLNIKDKPEESDIVLYFLKRNPDCPVGGRCLAKVCHDEFDKKIPRPEAKTRDQAKNLTKKGDTVEPKLSKKYYECKMGSKEQWFMNLDSTLKEKRYNH